jgi:hypothetical protein
VRIDGTIHPEHLNPNGKPLGSKSRASESRGADAGGALDRASTQQPLIQAALAAEEVNVKAVEEARKALQNGELDTPEAARRAAEAILDLGF